MNPHEVNQLARDVAAIINAYIGPQGEIVVDTDSFTIRLQDGSTAGGRIFAPLDITDSRYQALNGFLTALIALQGVPGFLYVSPTNVGTRPLVFDPAQFDVDPNVLATDPFEIVLKRTQTGAWVFGSVTAGTFSGNLIGDSTGNHTGNVTGNLTGNSNGNHSGPSSGLHTGGVDSRGAVLTFDPNQVPDAALSAAAQEAIALRTRVAPQWSIIMWDANRAIPAGWQECDGTNGTMDMRGFFPVGVSSSDLDFGTNTTGGQKSHNHAATTAVAGGHAHSLNVDGTTLTEAQIPAHQHGCGIADDNVDSIAIYGTQAAGRPGGIQSNTGAGRGALEPLTQPKGGSIPHTHTGSTDTQPGHTHTVTVDDFLNLPPYKTIRFIQRVAA